MAKSWQKDGDGYGWSQGEEVRIVDRTIIKKVGDRFEIEWQLSTKWAEIFQLAAPSDRHGSVEWVKGGGPDVIGAVVRWFVPSGVIENADAEVRHRLSVANQRFGLGYATWRWRAPKSGASITPTRSWLVCGDGACR